MSFIVVFFKPKTVKETTWSHYLSTNNTTLHL